ncbi:MAG: hypothetical protein FJ130_14360 [Deltaproteobacteria bacterium]|nr:hypothetical protein [Deltaproteobacteria bacterium]
MHLPTATLERKRIQRIVFSIRPSSPVGQNIHPLMEKICEMGGWCFDLPTAKHLESFKTLRESTGDEALTGFGHVEAESGVSLTGKPLHQFESKVVSTIVRSVIPPDSAWKLFPSRPYDEVLTQKEIDRMTFDPSRFDQTLAPFQLNEVPFLLLGGKYGDWLLGLGRGDLLKEMVSQIRRKGFIPIFSSLWATFALPKAKALDVVGYAIPINKKKSLFDLEQACNMIKKFDRPVISLDPLSGGELLEKPGEAFSFIFDELKIYSAIAEINSEDEVKSIFGGLENISSLIPFRKT